MIFSLITLVHTHEFEPACNFVYSHPQMHFHLIVFTVTATLGQLFIFQTIKNFGAVVFAITMNTRIILSILASCAIYSHSVSSQGFFGLFVVIDTRNHDRARFLFLAGLLSRFLRSCFCILLNV